MINSNKPTEILYEYEETVLLTFICPACKNQNVKASADVSRESFFDDSDFYFTSKCTCCGQYVQTCD